VNAEDVEHVNALFRFLPSSLTPAQVNIIQVLTIRYLERTAAKPTGWWEIESERQAAQGPPRRRMRGVPMGSYLTLTVELSPGSYTVRTRRLCLDRCHERSHQHEAEGQHQRTARPTGENWTYRKLSGPDGRLRQRVLEDMNVRRFALAMRLPRKLQANDRRGTVAVGELR
jgi:hypothetical protein